MLLCDFGDISIKNYFFNFFLLNHMENGNKNSSTEAILKVHIPGEVPSKAWKSILSKYLISIS
jgi:hypothetical protein